MTTTSSDRPGGPVCTVCGSLEEPGVIHGPGGMRQHPFTNPDQPEWIPPKKAKRAEAKGPVTSQRTMIVAPAPDLALRSLLVAKGLLTDDELREAEDALRFPSARPSQVLPDGSDSG